MVGILEKVFGKKKEEVREDEVVRIEPKRPEDEDYTGQRWKLAKKWREQKEMEQPLVKRRNLK